MLIVILLVRCLSQFKVQSDIRTDGKVGYSFRHVLFLNYLMTNDVVPGLVGGYCLSRKEDFRGLEFIRLMAGVSFRISDAHFLGLNYFLGIENKPGGVELIGGPLIQLTINLRSDWEYRPARIYSF